MASMAAMGQPALSVSITPLSTMPSATSPRPSSRARAKDGKDGLIDLVTHATLQGNNISVRMLEFLTTFKHVPTGFRDLAYEFLEICRILWGIEAGLLDMSRHPEKDRDLPADMEVELASSFRVLNADFAALGHMLFRFLEYEKNGALGRLQKGWRMMFADKEIARTRQNLKKSRDSLRMSALVFKWSGGKARTDGSMAMGYAGLSVALERMKQGKSVTGTSVAQLEAEANEAMAAKADKAEQADRVERPGKIDSLAYQSVYEHRGLPQLPLITPDDSSIPLGLGHALSLHRVPTPDLTTRDDFLARKPLPPDASHVPSSRHSSRSERHAAPFDRPIAHHPPSPASNNSHSGPQHRNTGPARSIRSGHEQWRDSRPSAAEHLQGSLHSARDRGDRSPVLPPGSPYHDSATVHTPKTFPPVHQKPRPQNGSYHAGSHHASSYHAGSYHAGSYHGDPRYTAGSFHRQHVADESDFDSPFNEDDLFDKVDETSSNDTVSTQVVRLKPDPSTVPRWTPRNVSPGSQQALRASLIGAIRGQKHKLVQDLLDRGASPNTMPEACVLIEAILNRDAESVRLLLLFGADPDILDLEGVTPLLTAVDEECMDAGRLLLKYGANPNLTAGPNSESPLALAVSRCNIDFAHLLLTWGGDPDLVMANGETAFIRSMTKGAPRRLGEILLDYGADPNAKTAEGKTPLHDAIQARRVDLMQLLMDKGCDPNLPGPKHLLWPSSYHAPCLKIMLSRGADHRKCPGIMELAAGLNNIDSIRLLLKAGVDPNLKKDGVYTPLCTAIRDNRSDIFELLLASGADPNIPASEYAHFKAVRLHRLHMLPRLLEAGCDLNTPKGLAEHCVHANHLDTLVWVLDHGVGPDDKNAEGHTALTTAIREGRLEMIDTLLARGADPSVKGEDWPIHMAVHHPVILAKLLKVLHNPRTFRGVLERAVFANQLDSVKQLLAAGVSVEDKNGGVFSPLTTALREERKEIVYFLLRSTSDPLGGGGADPNEPGEHLPLVKALRRCRGPEDTEMIELLITKGADVNRMYRGWNAIMQAVENGDLDILKVVLDGARRTCQFVDTSIKDDAGRTALDIADGRRWNEASELLIAASI